MALAVAIIVGVLFAGGIYLLLERNLFEILLGIALLSHGTNVLLISMSGWDRDNLPPILEEGITDPAMYVDPLPQALILTAIVIGFALLSFLMVLAARTYEATGTLEATEMPDEEAAE